MAFFFQISVGTYIYYFPSLKADDNCLKFSHKTYKCPKSVKKTACYLQQKNMKGEKMWSKKYFIKMHHYCVKRFFIIFNFVAFKAIVKDKSVGRYFMKLFLVFLIY